MLNRAFSTQSKSKSAHVILAFTASLIKKKQTDPDETVVLVTYKSLDIQLTSTYCSFFLV